MVIGKLKFYSGISVITWTLYNYENKTDLRKSDIMPDQSKSQVFVIFS